MVGIKEHMSRLNSRHKNTAICLMVKTALSYGVDRGSIPRSGTKNRHSTDLKISNML